MKRILALVAFSVSAAFAQPAITQVLDGGAYTNNVAQGSVFVVKGTGLSAAGFEQAAAPLYPTTLNSVRITLTAVSGGAVVNALMVYTYNLSGVNQLAAVLPSNATIGAYDLRVTNGASISAAFRTNVQARKPGIVTAAGDGNGAAQATVGNASALVRTSNLGKIGAFDSRPARPGERVDFWGTGLGPDSASDTGGTSGDQTSAAAIRVIINGAEVTPLYAGRSFGYPGLDQIAVNLPANVTASCTVSIQIRAGGVLSNAVTIAVSTTDTCTTPGGGGGGGGNTGLTQSEIDAILARGSYRSGGVSVSRTTVYTAATIPGTQGTTTRSDIASGSFTSVSGPDLPLLFGASTLPPGFAIPAHGVCNFFDTTTIPIVGTNLTSRYLDAGSALTVQGPAGSRTLARANSQQGNLTYHVEAGPGTPGNYLDPGSYTMTGPGGPDVGSFNVSIDVAPELIWTNRTLTNVINRSSGATITWSGGEPTQLVFISGISIVANIDNPSQITGAAFQCYANQSAGSFTIPASVLTRLPPTTETTIPGVGSFVLVPGTISLSSIGKIAFAKPSGLDSLVVSSSSSVAQTVTFR